VRRKGLVVGKSKPAAGGQSSEPVPNVIRLHQESDIFHLDQQYLSGLVGFDSGRIHRPGLLLHLFEDTKLLHGRYNQEIASMLKAGLAFGASPDMASQPPDATRVEVLPFGASQSEAMHAAITSFHDQEKPLDRTVLFTIDEFSAPLDPESPDFESARRQWEPVPPGEGLVWDQFLLSGTSPEFLNHNNNTAHFWPYYSNLLLLAYRKDGLDTPEDPVRNKRPERTSWEEVEDLADGILLKGKTQHADSHYQKDKNSLPPIKRAFWFDLSAAETLACLILDALCAANGRRGLSFLNTRGPESQFSEDEMKEIRALTSLLWKTNVSSPDNAEIATPGASSKRKREIAPPEAGVYVLWYSQLRALIERWPALATELDVCPLPGRGFRGDWFAGVVKGSVSPALGQRIIRILCGQAEDHKRYVRGVGLPARSLFYKPYFYAWPRSKHVTLADIEPYWENAASRRQLQNYHLVRSDIFALARQLTPMAGPPLDSDPSDFKELLNTVNIGRFFPQIHVLQ
jgi:hypothetical protein